MSSRGQRGPSLATSQRKHRSRSAPRYDLEKKPKKKDAKAAGTSSLVSIPNSIKLTMLNSGLISFETKALSGLEITPLRRLSERLERPADRYGLTQLYLRD
ncbi:unnamed protein product [Leptidea sinapis]|uniref:Uncharacterized protein n=1 Tax=Leptidea sinapis TaxID=189913 RepID=A0A5E4QSS0_9NEOP|nr:unnamed protein product [Leptidea sinapis]